MPKPIAKSFRATLERPASRLNWIIIRTPFDVFKVWGTRGRLKVSGDINGFAFRTSLFPSRHGGHIMIVNKRMQAGAKAAPGTVAQFRMEPDLAERTVTVPLELARALAGDRALRRWFDQLNYSTRKDIANWITDVKSAEARQRRAEQIAERLLLTTEAERELPPILRVAFARNPRAGEGWNLMSMSRRRGHLFGIFYYRDPEARARRLAKAVEDAVALAERRRSGSLGGESD
ncbi:MAG: YdeI/OmpD-associated family protein [Acidobacteriia bacterium]|nr:YdeI/OmpD-associated family protein [Terriglobia bacterium]